MEYNKKSLIYKIIYIILEAKVTCFSIISRNLILSSDFYEYSLRPTFFTSKDNFYYIIGIYIKAVLISTPHVTFNTYKKLYNSDVCSILDYASEIWGFVELEICKFLLPDSESFEHLCEL